MVGLDQDCENLDDIMCRTPGLLGQTIFPPVECYGTSSAADLVKLHKTGQYYNTEDPIGEIIKISKFGRYGASFRFNFNNV